MPAHSDTIFALDVGKQVATNSQDALDIENNDYLDGLNIMGQTDASALADFVAKKICADDNISGVQFDLEPFELTGNSGRLSISDPLVMDAINKNPKLLSTSGQYYFYLRIAADFQHDLKRS